MKIWKPFIAVFVFVFISTNSTYSQRKKKDQDEVVQEKKETVDSLDIKGYTQAVQYGDVNSAVTFIYRLMAQQPEKRLDYMDSLVTLYYYGGLNAQVVLIGRELLKEKAKDTRIMGFVAGAERNLGRNKEALDMYEELFPVTKEIFHAYQIGVLQYELKRFGECAQTLAALAMNPEAAKQGVQISAGRGAVQQVPINAAAFNILGVVNIEMNQPDLAKQYFEKALEVKSDFALAKANLVAITSKKEESDSQPKKK